MRNNCISIKDGTLVYPKPIIEFILGGRHSNDDLELNNEYQYLCNIVEYIFVHLPYLKIPLYIDLPATFYLFSLVDEDDLKAGYSRWSIGIPRILAAWINYYKDSRLSSYNINSIKDLKRIYWWMVEDLLINNYIKFEDFKFVLFNSELSFFNNKNFQFQAFCEFYNIDYNFKNINDEYLLINIILSKNKSGELFLDNDIWLLDYINKKQTNVILKLLNESFNHLLKNESLSILLEILPASFSIQDVHEITIDEKSLGIIINNVDRLGMNFIYTILLKPLFNRKLRTSFFRRIHNILMPTDFIYLKKLYGAFICSSNGNSIKDIKLNQHPAKKNIIIGRFSGGSGVGEDARMYYSVLSRLTDDVITIDTEEFNPSYAQSTASFKISLCCMPPWDYLTERLRYPQIGNDCNTFIGYWPWELPFIPSGHDFIFDDFDEILVPSKFVYDCFSRYTKKPIHILTAPVNIINIDEYSKSENEIFTFLIMFDCSSSIHRKNPFSAIKSFIDLYGNNSNYRLIIKTMNASLSNIYYKKLCKSADGVKNIQIINQLMKISDIYSIISSADCYISTHRSEGFGRIIAEAMLLKTPTITSGWSGNIDFCNDETSYLVSGKLVPVKPFEYGFSKGQHWFEPDQDSLMHSMQIVAADKNKKVENAFELINTKYSVDEISSNFKRIYDGLF